MTATDSKRSLAQLRKQTLTSVKLKDWLEVVGIFALVVSLIFVGLQMKQAQDIAIAEQYQVRAIYGAEHVSSVIENEHLLESAALAFESSYQKGELGEIIDSDYEAFGSAYVIIQQQLASKVLVTFDNYYFQYEQGFMEDEAWFAFRHRFKEAMRREYLRTLFLDDPLDWRKPFRELCFDLIAEIEAEFRSAD